MIIEYRKTSYNGGENYSRILRTYKDVTAVRQNENTVYLYGTDHFSSGRIKDAKNLPAVSVEFFPTEYFIAAIRLGEDEYLERVDLPRD